ncbi:MAG: hypothetical protein RLZ83_2043, partial [Pseudomonadota bacterium]
MIDPQHAETTFQTALLDALPNPVFVKGHDLRFTAINRAYERAFGVERGDLIGKTVLELGYLPAAQRTAFDAADRALIDAGGQTEEEMFIAYADGKLRTTVYQRKTFDQGGGRRGMIGTLIDISSRKRQERLEAFRSSTLEMLATHGNLREVLETIVTGVEAQAPMSLCSLLMLDETGTRLTGGIAPHLPQFYNDAIEGLQIGDGVGSCGTAAFTRRRVIVEDIQTHPYWAPFKGLAAQAGVAACWSEPVLSADGQVLGTFAIYHLRPTRPEPQDIALIEQSAHLASIAIERSRTMDHLARKEADLRAMVVDLERAVTEAQAAAQAKSSFLANMSHEIRTPMNAIIGLTELTLRTPLTARQQDYLSKVHLAANSLLGILNDILDLTKIESGKLNLEVIAFNLDDVLDSLATVMAVQIEEKGLELLFSRHPNVPTHLVGDPLRLSQVLTNLVGNARKFTERGDIIVSTEVVSALPDRVRLRFAVHDSGIGMTEVQRERLFKPFSQADDST